MSLQKLRFAHLDSKQPPPLLLSLRENWISNPITLNGFSHAERKKYDICSSTTFLFLISVTVTVVSIWTPLRSNDSTSTSFICLARSKYQMSSIDFVLDLKRTKAIYRSVWHNCGVWPLISGISKLSWGLMQ